MNIHRYILSCFFLCGTFFTDFAQPDIHIESTMYRNNQFEVYFNILCGGFKKFDLNASDFTVAENGLPIRDFTVSCPDPNLHCCKTIGLVSMLSVGILYDTASIHFTATLKAFVEKMDPCDEAAFVKFDNPIRVKQSVTSDTAALKKAINEFLESGDHADVEGAIIRGIQEAEKGHNNPCKAIVVFTQEPGEEGNSFTFQQVIDTALAHGYKIYFCVVETNSLDYSDLKNASNATGGKYFGATDTSLVRLVNTMRLIYDIIDGQNKFCTLTYNSPCKDGTTRNVDLVVTKCGGTSRKTVSYTVPYDINSFIPVTIKIDEAAVTGGENLTLPITISPQVNALFEPSTFRILYDPACCTFLGLDSTNSIFKGLPLTVQLSPGVITIATNTPFMLDISGVLTSLRFKASDPEQDAVCFITFESWIFDHGCLNPTLLNGKIIINARKPLLDCMLNMPESLSWYGASNNYTSNPFTAFITITNSGNREARNVKAKITLPSDNSLTLAGPMVDTQPATPQLMTIGSQSTADWSVNAKERMKSDSLQICIEVWADNHPSIQCCRKIYIPVIGARLACALSVEKIKVDTKLNRYTPMPFKVIDTVKNTGGLPTDTVYTTIILPPGLSLANLPNNSQIKRAQPIRLLPQSYGTASWQLYHSITTEEKKYIITICNRTSNADSVCCDVEVIIPQIDAPVLECTVTAVDSLFYDEAKDEYNPNPFPFTVAVKNNGSLDADSVRATIVLPPEFVLEPPTQLITKYFNPMIVVKYVPTLPANEISWMVKALDQKIRKASGITVKINGVIK